MGCTQFTEKKLTFISQRSRSQTPLMILYSINNKNLSEQRNDVTKSSSIFDFNM